MLGLRHLSLASAESCTGGLLAERLTAVPGSSRYFLGGAVVYSDQLKTLFAGVPEEMIATHGPVSEPVARALAEGIRARTGASIGVGITGIAGPGPGAPGPDETKPIGLVYIAVCRQPPAPRSRSCTSPATANASAGGPRSTPSRWSAAACYSRAAALDAPRLRVPQLHTLPACSTPTETDNKDAAMNPWLLSIPLAYLLGSIPFGYLLVRIFRKQDIRATGSGNIGATNVARSGAKGLGLATLALDLGKAWLAVFLAQRLGAALPNPYDLAVAAGIAAILGHVFPVWLGFRGGKGVASGLGVFLALTWPSALCILAVFLVVFFLTRYVSLASIVAAAAFPLFGFHFVALRTPIVIAGFLFIPLLIIVKHHQNIRRLLSGTESRFGSRKAVA